MVQADRSDSFGSDHIIIY